MRRCRQRGQAVVMATVALGVFLLGAIGLAIDTAQLYAMRQMAQAAADAAAQAAVLSMFNKTNVGANEFATATDYKHTCGAADAIAPCSYAARNGFPGGGTNTVSIDVPTPADIGLDPGILSPYDPVNLLRVSITRKVSTWFMPLLGGAVSADVSARATAALVGVTAPTPILVTHPSLDHALSTNGTTLIQICGGPDKSIQVNSASSVAYASPKAGGLIDLSKAGPADAGDCTTGTGADFGVFGGASENPGSVSLGSTGDYLQPSSIVKDPFAGIPQPLPPDALGSSKTIKAGEDGCVYTECTEYSPGRYPGGLEIKGGLPVIFRPGLYYLQGGSGFQLKNVVAGGGAASNWNAMCVGCAEDSDTGAGMVVFDTGPAGSTAGSNPAGGFSIDTNVSVTLKGSTKTEVNAKGETVPKGPYYGMLFWEDRTADAHTGTSAHKFGKGNGCFTLIGNIYATNTDSIMANPAHYQEVEYNGNPCSNTVQQGYIVVSSLQIVGTTVIKMNLNQKGFLTVRRIALVK